MKKNETLAWVVVVILVGGLMFFAGTKYAAVNRNKAAYGGQQRFGQNTTLGGARNGGQKIGGNAGGLIGGEILAKDDKSVTVKMRDGGSKIIFFTSSTSVQKSATGTLEDLKVGDNISASGPANPDGSINAASIQLRPDLVVNTTTKK